MGPKVLRVDAEYIILDKRDALPDIFEWQNKVYHHFRDGLYFSPGISDRGLANLYGNLASDFDYESTYLKKEFNLLVYHHLLKFASLCLTPSTDLTILDYACGTGLGLVEIKKQFPDCRILGFDLSDVMVCISGEKYIFRSIPTHI